METNNSFEDTLIKMIWRRAPVNEIQALVEQLPKAEATRKVLSSALSARADSAVLRMLIEHDTECAKFERDEGWFLLHDACQRDAPLDIIKLVLDLNPAAACARDSVCGMMALHFAVCVSPYSVVQELIWSNVEAINAKDNGGFGTLHWACMTCSHLGIVQLLMEWNAFLVTEKSNDGSLPIHIACGGMDTAKFEVIAYLADFYQESHGVADNSGEIPLHVYLCHVQDRQHQSDFLGALIDAYPDGIHHSSNGGFLPLHAACTNRNVHLESVRLLVERGNLSALLREAGNNNQAPLQIACRNRCSSAVKTFLAEKQAEAMQVRRQELDTCFDELGLPDLVKANMWELVKPTVWEPEDDDLLSVDSSEDEFDY